MGERRTKVTRSTEQTEVVVVLDVDGEGRGAAETGIPLLDQMLLLFSRQGMFDLEVRAAGDADPGMVIEEVGLCLGLAFDKALGIKRKIKCTGHAIVPVEEYLARAVVEITGHPCLVFRGMTPAPESGGLDAGRIEHFWRAFVSQARLTLHLEVLYGGDGILATEAVFKAAARALQQACGGE
jgi:imidazoleglycerol-phosphate dehydratase